MKIEVGKEFPQYFKPSYPEEFELFSHFETTAGIPSLMENSEAVRQHGLEMFMKEQKEKYTCQKCGGIISIHDRECSECQEKMK